MRLAALARGLQLTGDRERLLDLLDRPVERLDEVASDERRPVYGYLVHGYLAFMSSC